MRAPPGAAKIAGHFGLSQLAPHAGAFVYPLLARCVEGARCTGSTTMYALHASLLDHRGSARAGLTSCCDRCAASLSDPCACSLWQALHGSPISCSTSHCRRPSHLASHHRHSHHRLRHRRPHYRFAAALPANALTTTALATTALATSTFVSTALTRGPHMWSPLAVASPRAAPPQRKPLPHLISPRPFTAPPHLTPPPHITPLPYVMRLCHDAT